MQQAVILHKRVNTEMCVECALDCVKILVFPNNKSQIRKHLLKTVWILTRYLFLRSAGEWGSLSCSMSCRLWLWIERSFTYSCLIFSLDTGLLMANPSITFGCIPHVTFSSRSNLSHCSALFQSEPTLGNSSNGTHPELPDRCLCELLHPRWTRAACRTPIACKHMNKRTN